MLQPMREPPSFPAIESTFSLLREGYCFASNRRARLATDAFSCRLLLQTAVFMGGPEAVPAFFDTALFERERVVPRRIRRTLLGDSGVHSLDGEEQRLRKAMFLQVLAPPRVASFRKILERYWNAGIQSWHHRRVPIFRELCSILCGAGCEFAGIPTPEVGDSLCEDLLAMVDSFGAVGPRHWRGRSARRRREKWAADLVAKARRERVASPGASALQVIAHQKDTEGRLLAEEVAAVELLNATRPIMAVAYFGELAAALLVDNPEYRINLTDPVYLESFVHELRRYCPFTPFLGARTCRDVEWTNYIIPKDTLTLLDVYGVHHDQRIWNDADAFLPDRFIGKDAFKSYVVQQGGGDHANGHRCAGEWITVEALKVIVSGLSNLSWQNKTASLSYDLRRIPARLESPVVLELT